MTKLLPSKPPGAWPSVSTRESSLCSEEVFIESAGGAGRDVAGTIFTPKTVPTVILCEDSNQRCLQVFTQRPPFYQQKTSAYSCRQCLSKIRSPLNLKH